MPSQRRRGPARAGGYSLVELLVVIGIITLLIGILLPVVNGVRRAANATYCLATLHQWGAAFQMYAGEHRGRSMAYEERPGPRTNPGLWWEQLEPYHPETTETLLCPDATEPADYTPDNAFEAWGPKYLWPEAGRTRQFYVGSYGMNGWVYPSPDAGPEYVRLPHRRADRVPVFFDSADSLMYPQDTDSTDFDPASEPINLGYGWMRGVAMYRHRQGVNVIFADGHAGHVEAAELWNLQWSQDFTPRRVTFR